MDARKHGMSVPVPDGQVQSYADFRRELDESDIAQREAAEGRRHVRERDGLVIPDTDLVRVVEETMHDRLRWPSGYLNHLAQPYCDCETDREDGWVFCAHARDLWPELA